MIKPGYKFHVVDLLQTNFHAPDSTLMLMVSAFSGTEEIKLLYQAALDKGFKFLSYGDCCLLKKKKPDM